MSEAQRNRGFFLRYGQGMFRAFTSPVLKFREARHQRRIGSGVSDIGFDGHERSPMGKIVCRKRSAVTVLSSEDLTLKHVDTQVNCSLMAKLPPEVRRLIWLHYAGDMMIHLHIKKLATGLCMCGLRCLEEGSETCIDVHGAFNGCEMVNFGRRSITTPKYIDVVSLLLTCRQIYSEVIEIFYSTTKFITMEEIIVESMPEFFLPQRIDTIRYLHFSWSTLSPPPLPPYGTQFTGEAIRHEKWNNMWQTLSKMKGLIELEVAFMFYGQSEELWRNMDASTAASVVSPLRSITTPKHFDILIPRLNSRCVEVWESLPARIVWSTVQMRRF